MPFYPVTGRRWTMTDLATRCAVTAVAKSKHNRSSDTEFFLEIQTNSTLSL